MTPQQLLTRNANIIERHIGMEETPLTLSNSTGISIRSIQAIINLYTDSPTHDMVLQSKANYGYRDWFIYDNWASMAIQEIAEVLACSTIVIKRRAAFLSLSKKTRVVINNPVFAYRNRTVVLNMVTGIYYFSNNEAAATIGMNRNTFKNKMNGNRINNTDFLKVA